MMAKRPIAAIEPPPCPKCGERMLLIRLVPNGAGSDVQTFECAKCGQTQTIETADPVNETAARPVPGDLRPLQ